MKNSTADLSIVTIATISMSNKNARSLTKVLTPQTCENIFFYFIFRSYHYISVLDNLNHNEIYKTAAKIVSIYNT